MRFIYIVPPCSDGSNVFWRPYVTKAARQAPGTAIIAKVDSEAPPSDLGIFRVTEAGYPVLRWYSRAKWEGDPEQPDEQFVTFKELEGNFKWLLSKPESRLVVLVTFFQQQPTAEVAKRRRPS